MASTAFGIARDECAVVGIGNTDYAEDYRLSKAGHIRSDAYGLGAIALARALKDCGLDKSDIDGLVVGPSTATERLGEVLGLDPRWSVQADAPNAVISAVTAIQSGLAECVALIYGNDQKSVGTAYGGGNAMGGDRFLSYVYYAPWGLTSQGGLYALLASRYMALTGFRPEDLGQFVINQRRFAEKNPNAIMRKPLGIDEYLASRFICEPLRLFDYCLINDGGVALIITTRDRARRLKQKPVTITAVARADMNKGATSLKPRIKDFYHSAHRQAADELYAMAGFGPEAINVAQIYDSFSIHIPVALEGFGYCAPGDAARLARETGPGGRWPVNTSGGMLSESYMQGWNHQIELVRQLRGEAGERQVEKAAHGHYMSDVAGKVATIIYSRSNP